MRPGFPAPVFEEVRAAETEFDEIDEAIAAIDEWLGRPGWVLDSRTALITWSAGVPPSAEKFDDSDSESVTRI